MRVVIGELKSIVDEALPSREVRTPWQPVTLTLLVADDEEDVWSAHPVKIPAKKCGGRVRNRPQRAGDHDEIHRPRLRSPEDRTDVAL